MPFKDRFKGPFKGRNRAASAEQLEVMQSYNSQETTKFFAKNRKFAHLLALKLKLVCNQGRPSQPMGSNIDQIERTIEPIESNACRGFCKEKKQIKMPLFGELRQMSLNSFESDSNGLIRTNWDDQLNSPKGGKNKKCHFSASEADRPRICSNRNPIRKNPGTFVV